MTISVTMTNYLKNNNEKDEKNKAFCCSLVVVVVLLVVVVVATVVNYKCKSWLQSYRVCGDFTTAFDDRTRTECFLLNTRIYINKESALSIGEVAPAASYDHGRLPPEPTSTHQHQLAPTSTSTSTTPTALS